MRPVRSRRWKLGKLLRSGDEKNPLLLRTAGSNSRLSFGNLVTDIDYRLTIAGRKRVARAAAIPDNGEAPFFLQNAREFRQRVGRTEPVNDWAQDKVGGPRRKPRRVGSPV